MDEKRELEKEEQKLEQFSGGARDGGREKGKVDYERTGKVRVGGKEEKERIECRGQKKNWK